MLMQGIKRLLQSLFARWPWRRAEELDYAQATGPLNRGTVQESMFRKAVDGPFTQPFQQNITTISIQPSEEEDSIEWPSFESRERTHPLTPPFSSTSPISPISPISPMPPMIPIFPEDIEEAFSSQEFYESQQAQQALTGLRKSQAERVLPESPIEPLEPATLQRLEFLRYLIQRGIVSDDIP